MSFVRLGLQAIGNASRASLQRVISVRSISYSFIQCQQDQAQLEENASEESSEINTEPHVDPRSDRSKLIPVETSIKYLDSDAYKETYGDDPVWKRYRRNFKGQLPPNKTRKTCIRNRALATSNPCPICRDEYLVLDHRNTKLLNQFISSYNGEIISFQKTGLCQKQHQNLLIAMYRAKDFGTISFDVPFRTFDYSEWYKPENKAESEDKE